MLHAELAGDARLGQRIGGAHADAGQLGHGFPLTTFDAGKSTARRDLIHAQAVFPSGNPGERQAP